MISVNSSFRVLLIFSAMLVAMVLALISGGVWYSARLKEAQAELTRARAAEVETAKQLQRVETRARESELEAESLRKKAAAQTALANEHAGNVLRLAKEQRDQLTTQAALKAQELERKNINIKASIAGHPMRECDTDLGTEPQRVRFNRVLNRAEDLATQGALASARDYLDTAEKLYPGDALTQRLREKIRIIEDARKTIEATRIKNGAQVEKANAQR